MFRIAAIMLLSLAGCAQLTGDPAADCLAARNAVRQAQTLSMAASVIAASNPKSAQMQTAAALAASNLASAVSLQTSVCPAF
ncbi:MAG: hypothetical protein JWQ44_2926 [Chthoniobacter sp.]|nr:hypothetical protein [Chthoniobacter sp.]